MPVTDDTDDRPKNAGSFEASKETLEKLAIATWMDLMSDSLVDPSVRKSTADAVMKALGKDAPPKSNGPGQIVFNFQGGLKSALSGMGELQNLLARPAPDQATEFPDEA